MTSTPPPSTLAVRLAELIDRFLGRPPRMAPALAPVTVRRPRPGRLPVERS